MIIQLNMTILQRFKNALLHNKYRLSQIFRGQHLSEVESSFFLDLQHNPKDKLTLKLHQYSELNNFLVWFLNSAATGGRVTGDNLTFVIGAQRVGKTHFLESGIENFRRLKSENAVSKWKPDVHRYVSPEYYEYESRCRSFDNEFSILLSFNFSDKKLLNFQGLVDSIQEEMIGELVRMNKKLGGKMLDHDVVKEVLLGQNAEEYLFIYLKDTIYSIINGTDPIYLPEEQDVLKLQEINETIKTMEAHDFFTSSAYEEVVRVLSDALKLCMTQTAIRLFVSVGKRIEYEHRNNIYQNSWYTTGIESTDVLLDLLNFLCGFGAYNRAAVQRFFKGETPEVGESNWIKAGNRIDVGLLLMNLDELSIWGSQSLYDFIDHLVSRTAGANGIRTHFPIVIELPNGSELQDMLSMGQFQIGTVPFIQIPGYLNHALLRSGLAKIFAPKILKRLYESLGKNPHIWTQAITALGAGTSIDEVVKGQAEFIRREAIRAEAKFNRIFTTQQAQPSLADETIRYELIQHLRFLLKANGSIVLDRPGYYLQYMTRPLFQAMQRQGLLYHSLYLGCVDLSQLVTLHKLSDIKNSLFNNNINSYVKWRIANRGRYSMLSYEFIYKQKYDEESRYYDMFLSYRPQNQLAQTYYGPGFNYQSRYSRYGVSAEIAV